MCKRLIFTFHVPLWTFATLSHPSTFHAFAIQGTAMSWCTWGQFKHPKALFHVSKLSHCAIFMSLLLQFILESPRPTCREILQRVLSFNSGNVLTSTNDWLTHVRWSLPPLKLLWFSDSNHFQHFSVSCGSFLLEFCNFRFQLSLILQLGLLSLLVFTSLYDMFVEIWLQLDASGLRCRISGS